MPCCEGHVTGGHLLEVDHRTHMEEHELCDPFFGFRFLIKFAGWLERERARLSQWLCEGLCRRVGQKELFDDLCGLLVVIGLNAHDDPTGSIVQR
jgi:hypothetical protein